MVVNLVAIPGDSYHFVNWSGDVGTIADVEDATNTITMNDNYSIIANFATRYVLAIDSTDGGEVTTPGKGSFTYDPGIVVDLVAEAGEGYQFVSWTGDVGTIADVEDATTTITIDSHYSITANFVEGDVALDFTLPTMTGANITLSELEGTPVVLNFWSISCPWCRTQLPYLESIAQQSEGQLEVIAISIRDSASEIQTFFGEDEPTMIIALGKNSETFADYCQKYGNSRWAIPFTLFVDGEGIVKHVKIGAFSSEAQLWDTLESVFGIQ
jgi:thiol-disulfide isomerase/thioredoxin